MPLADSINFACPEEELEEEIPEGSCWGPAAPWMLRPLTNVYRPGGPAYIWIILENNDFDLEPVECSDNKVGVRPGWLSEEIRENGFDGIIETAYKCIDPYGGSWVYWGITNGIGIGQPFCVEIYPPCYSKSSGWDGPAEWDAEWSWDIVRVCPRTFASAASSWDRFFRTNVLTEQLAERRKEELRRKQRSDPSALYLSVGQYFTSDQRYYDDEPRGLLVRLCSEHTTHPDGWPSISPELLCVRNDQGNVDGAIEVLIKEIDRVGWSRTTVWHRLVDGCKPTLRLHPDIIRKLPRKW